MRKRTLFLTLFIALPLLLLALRGLGGSGSPSAQAGAPFPEVSANVELFGSMQSWDIVSKATFAANRVDVAVGKPDQNAKVRVAGFVCADGTVAEAAEPKRVEPNPTPGSALPNDEVWSATFPSKCIVPGGSVNVSLLSADPRNKLVIKAAHVENTSLPQIGTINVRRIGNSRNWKVTFKDPSKGYNRVELYVGTGSGAQKVRSAVFFCQSTHQRVRGEFKRVDVNVNPDPARPNHEVWSGTFSRKCAGGVRARLIPVRCPDDGEAEDGESRCDRSNRIVVKGGIAINTTRPRTGPANPRLKKKTQYFRLTPKADFAANRIEVDVGTASNTQTIESALFVTGCPGPAVNGRLKAIVKNANLNTDPLPNHEVWSVEYPTKCISPLFAPVVVMVPKDPSKQVVIKAARFQNTIPPPTATDTPTSPPTPFLTPTPAATETEVPTPVGSLGGCTLLGEHVKFNHDLRTPVPEEVWDAWECSPGQNVDWNRVDIYIRNPSANQVRKVKAVQFDCQSNHSKANTIIRKGFIKGANQVEVWSGQDFKTGRNVPTKNCHGAVSIFLQQADTTNLANKPFIKKAVFSHTGLPKPTPQKLPSNGGCNPSPIAANPWTCTPNAGVPPFNRIDIKVASPTSELQLADVQAVCADGTVGVVDTKGQKVATDVNGVVTHHEVWSADFPHKCTGDVSVTLKPFPLRGTPVAGSTPPQIIGVVFSNIPQPTPTPKPAANGNCSRVVG